MDWFTWVLLALIILYFISRTLPVKGVENISTAQLKSIIRDKKIQFIDVRTPMEFQTERIKQFKNIPLQSLRKELDQLDQNKAVVLICRSGSRSMRAARMLKKAGFTNITNVAGGMSQWRG